MKHHNWNWSILFSNTVTGVTSQNAYSTDPGDYGNGIFPNIGWPSIWSIGGTNIFTNMVFTIYSRPQAILLMGDSISTSYGVSNRANSWPYLLEKDTGRPVEIEAGPGATSWDLTQTTNEARLLNADYWNVLIGGNDINKGTNILFTEQNETNIIAASNARVGVILCDQTPWQSIDTSPLSNFNITNNWPSSVLQVARTWELLQAAPGSTPSRNVNLVKTWDGTHFNVIGQQQIADYLLQIYEGL
jgi:lysophospholipase L1-like esterase